MASVDTSFGRQSPVERALEGAGVVGANIMDGLRGLQLRLRNTIRRNEHPKPQIATVTTVQEPPSVSLTPNEMQDLEQRVSLAEGRYERAVLAVCETLLHVTPEVADDVQANNLTQAEARRRNDTMLREREQAAQLLGYDTLQHLALDIFEECGFDRLTELLANDSSAASEPSDVIEGVVHDLIVQALSTRRPIRVLASEYPRSSVARISA